MEGKEGCWASSLFVVWQRGTWFLLGVRSSRCPFLVAFGRPFVSLPVVGSVVVVVLCRGVGVVVWWGSWCVVVTWSSCGDVVVVW